MLMRQFIPRAYRLNVPLPIQYRRPGDPDWMDSTAVNLSETGVLFDAEELSPGTPVEVIISPPIQIGSLATGKQVFAGEIVRADDVGMVAAKFQDHWFVLEGSES